jgi:hypothetical protein
MRTAENEDKKGNEDRKDRVREENNQIIEPNVKLSACPP